MDSIVKRLMENRENAKPRTIAVSLDPDKLQKAMESKGYEYPEAVAEFLYDEYDLEDGEHYQFGNGELDLLFYGKGTLSDKLINDLSEGLGPNWNPYTSEKSFEVAFKDPQETYQNFLIASKDFKGDVVLESPLSLGSETYRSTDDMVSTIFDQASKFYSFKTKEDVLAAISKVLDGWSDTSDIDDDVWDDYLKLYNSSLQKLDYVLGTNYIKEYSLDESIKEDTDPTFNEDLKKYVGKPLKALLADLSGKVRLDIRLDKPNHYGVHGFGGMCNQVTWEYADMLIKDIAAGNNRFVDIYIKM